MGLQKTTVVIACLVIQAIAVEDQYLETPQVIQKYGYTAESHEVTTEDGYILTLHRIKGGAKYPPAGNKKVVLLQHGVYCNSYEWVLLGPEKALGFLLSDKEYDVWLANARGNSYSTKHVTLSTLSVKYWNFSFTEMGKYDLPAVFDYILNQTGQTSLYYVGHSMGTTMFYVCMSLRPEYNDKIKYMVSLAPIAFMASVTDSTLKLLSYPAVQIILWILENLGVGVLLQTYKYTAPITNIICRDGSPLQCACVQYLYSSGCDYPHLNKTQLPAILSHYMDGISTKNAIHFGWEVESGGFFQFNYRFLNNQQYGQSTPPSYDLSKVTCPISLIRGEADTLSVGPDVEKLDQTLPNSKGIYVVTSPTFGHKDFIWGTDANTLVYDYVITTLASN